MQSEDDVMHSRETSLWQLPAQEYGAAETINIMSSYVGISAVLGSTNNFAAFASSSQPQAGNLVAVENQDDQDLTGALDCPGTSKCFFVHDVSGFQKFSQVDFY